MRLVVKHLSVHPKSGVYRFRRVFPVTLRPYLDGRTALTVSLNTRIAPGESDPRFLAAAEKYSEMVERAELSAALDAETALAGVMPITDELIAFLVGTLKADDADNVDHVRSVREPSVRKYRRVGRMRSDTKADLLWAKGMRGASDTDGMIAAWQEDILRSALAEGLALDPDGEGFDRLVSAYHDANIEIWERALLQTAGETVPAVTRPKRPKTSAPEPAKSFAAIGEAVSSNASVGFSGAMRQKTATALRLWREAHGDLEATAIRKRHVTDFIELLESRPKALPKEDRTLPLRELAKRYEGRADVPRLAKGTVFTHLMALRTLWNHADERGDIGGDEDHKLLNPFAGRKIAQKAGPAKKVHISDKEVEGIFSLPIFTHGERPGQGRGEAAYWLPLLLLWTGARPEEIAQLRLEDFSRDEDGERLMVSITSEGEHEHKGKMRLKTEASETGHWTFPIPLPLIALGLPDYLKWLEDAGETVLFPRLRAKGQRGNLFDSFGRWFAPMLKERGIIPEGPRRPLRELRGNWTTEARRAGVARDAREYIQGHSTAAAGTSANEIYGDRSPLGAQIDLVGFDRLDLSKIVRWKPPAA